MDKYEYGNIEDVKPGDIVEHQGKVRNDIFGLDKKLCIVTKVKDDCIYTDVTPDKWFYKKYLKLVKTKLSSEAKVGDDILYTEHKGTKPITPMKPYTIQSIANNLFRFFDDVGNLQSLGPVSRKVLCKSESKPTEKRNLAFYKRSGEPWTDEECENIVRYVKATDQIKCEDWGNVNPNVKYMYDDSGYNYMANWSRQEKSYNFKNCKQVAYEDIFEIPTTEPRVAIVTADVNGHPIGSRIVPIYNDNMEWRLVDNPLSSKYAHTIGNSCEWEDTLTTCTDTATFTPVDEISPATLGSQHDDIVDTISYITPIPEEETMNENITIAMTADEYAKYQKSNKTAKPKTDLETASKWMTIWYNLNGVAQSPTTESPKKAKKELQKPHRLGYTFRSYLITASATTDIPVVDVEV